MLGEVTSSKTSSLYCGNWIVQSVGRLASLRGVFLETGGFLSAPTCVV